MERKVAFHRDVHAYVHVCAPMCIHTGVTLFQTAVVWHTCVYRTTTYVTTRSDLVQPFFVHLSVRIVKLFDLFYGCADATNKPVSNAQTVCKAYVLYTCTSLWKCSWTVNTSNVRFERFVRFVSLPRAD